jgi:hypothetical protein
VCNAPRAHHVPMTIAQKRRVAELRSLPAESILCPPDPEDGSILVLAEAERGLRLLSVDREGRIQNLTPKP